MRSSLSEECASELSQRHFVTLFQLLRARADGHFQQSTACCLLHVVQRLAMAPAETDPAHKSSVFPQVCCAVPVCLGQAALL